MPNIGDRISFVPSAFPADPPAGGRRLQQIPHKVSAEIVYINHAHNWFRAEYTLWGRTMHECFKIF